MGTRGVSGYHLVLLIECRSAARIVLELIEAAQFSECPNGKNKANRKGS